MGISTVLDVITKRLEHSLTKTQAEDVLAAILLCIEYGLTTKSVSNLYTEENDEHSGN